MGDLFYKSKLIKACQRYKIITAICTDNGVGSRTGLVESFMHCYGVGLAANP